jgi:hypothetical protein
MKTEDKLYTAEDIMKAFDLGLESGLYALEKSKELPVEDQEYLLEELKKMINANNRL